MAAGDAATPLLEMAYQYHEGCPACAVERSKALNPGHPLHALLPHLDHHPRLMYVRASYRSLLHLYSYVFMHASLPA